MARVQQVPPVDDVQQTAATKQSNECENAQMLHSNIEPDRPDFDTSNFLREDVRSHEKYKAQDFD